MDLFFFTLFDKWCISFLFVRFVCLAIFTFFQERVYTDTVFIIPVMEMCSLRAAFRPEQDQALL